MALALNSPGFGAQDHCSQAEIPWQSSLTSLCLSALTYKWGKASAHWQNICKGYTKMQVNAHLPCRNSADQLCLAPSREHLLFPSSPTTSVDNFGCYHGTAVGRFTVRWHHPCPTARYVVCKLETIMGDQSFPK